MLRLVLVYLLTLQLVSISAKQSHLANWILWNSNQTDKKAGYVIVRESCERGLGLESGDIEVNEV